MMKSLFVLAAAVIRLGIIGLDTSHSTAFTELLNSSDTTDHYVSRFEVTAAYPWGSNTIESSYKRIPAYTRQVEAMGVEIVGSIAELIDKVDCILLETNDGRLPLEQALEVFRSGKPVYIDKPVGSTLGETIAIYELARRYGAKTFSSSALRWSSRNVELREGKYGPVLGADCYSPHKVEPTHPDFGFYGIHGVETLYTLMGRGCESVSRTHSESGDICTGRWSDGRLGTFRAIVGGPSVYGGTAFTAQGAVPAGGYDGYMVLLRQILDFFETGICPIDPEETIEIFTFMKASNLSLERGGEPVSMKEAYELGLADARRLVDATLSHLTVVDPGHFHAALIQKSAHPCLCDTVKVYAPQGPELDAYLAAVKDYGVQQLHCSEDFLQDLPEAGKGDFVVLSGDNSRKADYLLEAVRKGYHVLADKPMAIDGEGYSKLCEAYSLAEQKGLVIMDMMTERYDTLNLLCRSLIADKELFGEPVSARMWSLHHFIKTVDGKATKRPGWYYDTARQGEGIADVTTHLIDLLFWECFPGQAISADEVKLLDAEHYPTRISPKDYALSTGGKISGPLSVMCNGNLHFQLRGMDVQMSVLWASKAEPGASDSFGAVIQGTRGCVRLVQDATTGFLRELYFTPAGEAERKIEVPSSERSTHEEHFGKVAAAFLSYIRGEAQCPQWEVPNTIAKYKLTTQAVKMANE